MPQPKRRHSRSRQGKRRANWKAHFPNLAKCKNCGAATLPHQACANCGMYDGHAAIKLKEKKKGTKKA